MLDSKLSLVFFFFLVVSITSQHPQHCYHQYLCSLASCYQIPHFTCYLLSAAVKMSGVFVFQLSEDFDLESWFRLAEEVSKSFSPLSSVPFRAYLLAFLDGSLL